MNIVQVPQSRVKQSSPLTTVVAMAASFGVIAGLIEGAIFLILPSFNRMMGVNWSILWISPLVDATIFVVVGLALFAINTLLSFNGMILVAAWTFMVLTFANWLSLITGEYVHPAATLVLSIGLATVGTRWLSHRPHVIRPLVRLTCPALIAFTCLGGLTLEVMGRVRENAAVANLPAAAIGSPNVLVLVVDALRADHLKCYGYSRSTSPNLDQLAARGVVFKNAFATASYTLPSHASMLTGLYPHEHGVEWLTARALASNGCPTLGEALQTHGYRTAGFSANTFWFTHELGFDRGFSRFEDVFHSVQDMVLRTFFGRAFEVFVMRRLGLVDVPARKRAPDINSSILNWIDRDRTKPFFAFVNYFDVHDPYFPPEPFRNQFTGSHSSGGLLNWRLGVDDPTLSQDQINSEIDAYDGAIAYADDHIGKLLTALAERGPHDNTLVIVTSDHGEAFGEHGMYLHGHSLHIEEIHVPLIVSLPGRIPAGVQIDEPVTNASIPAAVMDFLPTPDSTTFPGPALSRLWQAPSRGWSRPPLSELAQRSWVGDKYPVRHGRVNSLVSGDWHYIHHEKQPELLFERKTDPLERHNAIDQPDHHDVAQQFRRRLEELRPSTSDFARPLTREWLCGDRFCGCGGIRRP